jgi:pimeloyl-ACP methyl ester carboxylesterase
MDSFQLPSHGALLNALVYLAAGEGPHPTVILLHGFPGNEKNLDLAQAIRRAGWNVLFFNYRGSWGSPGDFSFTHCIEDAQAAVAWLRMPANAAHLRSDPKRIVLIGHSMGGFVAIETRAADPGVEAVIAISAASMGSDVAGSIPTAGREAFIATLGKHLEAEGMAPLAGTSPRKLSEEILTNGPGWAFSTLEPKLAGRPFFGITSDDGLAPPIDALVAALQKAGSPAHSLHIPTDHGYNDHRIALTVAVLNELEAVEKK